METDPNGTSEVSPTLISNVTAQVMEEVKVWQGHPLSSVYPIVYFDALVAKSREEGPVTNKAWGLGNDCFRFRVEEQLNRPTAAKARGGDRKSKIYRESR
ncbi:MAG: transposase [Gammaproteobacteria bacterium]|nr:transposase [Gammaproteobacteria bacterium]